MTTSIPRKCDIFGKHKFSAGKYRNIKYCGYCGLRQKVMSANHDVHELLDKCPVDECDIVLEKEDIDFLSVLASHRRNRKRKVERTF